MKNEEWGRGNYEVYKRNRLPILLPCVLFAKTSYNQLNTNNDKSQILNGKKRIFAGLLCILYNGRKC
jgi:hypothetical protein